MIRRMSLGKILLGLLVLVLMSQVALAQSGPEVAWRLLIQQKDDQALQAAAAIAGPLGAWFQEVAALRLGEEAVSPDQAEVRRAARMVESHKFSQVGSLLDSLSTRWREEYPVASEFFDLQAGRAAIETGQIAAADSLLTLGVEAAAARNLPLFQFFALYNRGRARLRLRQIDPPREDLEAALKIAEQESLPRWCGDAALARSVVDRLQMDLAGARQWRQKALDFYGQVGYVVGQARALHYLSVIDLMEGNLAQAIAGLGQALDWARQAGDRKVEGAVLGELAGANYLLGDFSAALNQYQEAIRLVDNPWRQGMMLTNIGSIHEFQGDYEQAAEVLPRALTLIREAGDKRSEAQVLMSLGEVECEMKDFTEGLANLDQALALAREYEIPMTEAWALKVKGHGLLDKGDLTGAETALAAATTLARKVGYFEILEWSLLGQAMVARRQGHLEEALSHLEEALTEVDAVRRRSSDAADVAGDVTSQAAGIYAETIDVMYALHQKYPQRDLPQRAFAVNQEAKARIFLNLLTEADYDLKASAIPGFRQQESVLLRRMAELDLAEKQGQESGAPVDTLTALKARRAATQDGLTALVSRLKEKDPRYAGVLYPAPVGMADLQQRVLRPGELFLDYALGDSASYLWAVSRKDTRFVQLPSRGDLTRQVRAFLPLLADYNLTGGNPAWYCGPAFALYRVLLQPVADLIAASDHLVISPAGILHYLPFGALLTSEAPCDTWRQLPYLATAKVVSSVPSASVLDHVRSRPLLGPQAGWLLVGDPVLGSTGDADIFAHAAGVDGMPPLPMANEELQALAGLSNAPARTVLRGQQATLSAVAAASAEEPYAQVHFATHGLFNENHPRYSGLVLSPDLAHGGSSFVSVSDVVGLDLDCGQVVLAACATGLGRQVDGEGVVGLVRSFLFAGARSVVATMWNVAGGATARFMTDYYTQLTGPHGGDRSLALTMAQRDMIQESTGPLADGLSTAFPGFWAGFILSGDDRTAEK